MLGVLAEIFDKDIPETYNEKYLPVLLQYPTEEIEQAFIRILKTRTSPGFPSLTEIVEKIKSPSWISLLRGKQKWIKVD